MNVLGLFKSHYSIGRSILTLTDTKKEEEKLDRLYPISVFDIAERHKLAKIIIVDESISGFLEAQQNANKKKIELVYGLMLRCMDDITQKSDSSLKTISKIIIFIKNNQGYIDLIKISSLAAKQGFYYKPNIDYSNLKRLWTDNLLLAIPFYDGFLARNTFENAICVPNFSFTKPVFFIENSELPFDRLLQKKVKDYTSDILSARSIYYYQDEDFLSYLTFRCINDRTTISKPQLDNMASDKFSFQEWQRQEENPNSVFLV